MEKSGEEVGFISKLRHKFAKKSRQEVGRGDTRSLDKELSPKQKKIWLAGLFGALILIVGLLIAIVVVVNMQDRAGKTCGANDPANNIKTEPTEEEKREAELEAAMERRNAVISTVNRVVDSTVDADEDTVVAAYQYYISEEDDELAKLMLRLNLVVIEANYDMEKTRGDELIAVAKELDGELKTIDSAVAIMNMASFYGKDDLFEEYNAILMEREKTAGINRDDGSEGESKG